MSEHLKIIVGPNPQDNFQVLLGDEDVTDKLLVRSMAFKMDFDTGATTVDLECYADGVEVIADAVNVNIVGREETGQ